MKNWTGRVLNESVYLDGIFSSFSKAVSADAAFHHPCYCDRIHCQRSIGAAACFGCTGRIDCEESLPCETEGRRLWYPPPMCHRSHPVSVASHQEQLSNLMASHTDAQLKHTYDFDGFRGYAVHLPTGESLDALRAHPEIEYIEPDHVRRFTSPSLFSMFFHFKF